MCTIIEDLLPSSYYTSESLGAQADMFVLEDLLLKTMPEIHEILIKTHRLSLSVWMQSWFLTLFVGPLLPHQPLLLCRFLDWFFFCANNSSHALFGLALALIDIQREQIVAQREDGIALCNIISNLANSTENNAEKIMKIAAKFVEQLFVAVDSAEPVCDLQKLRQQHITRLMVVDTGLATPTTTTIAENSKSVVKNKDKKKILSTSSILFYSTEMDDALILTSGDAKREKNILQTELIIDLRRAVMALVQHFQQQQKADNEEDAGSSFVLNLTPDYSPESHFRDRETFIRASRRKKFQRARALLDFEAADKDELEFNKNDIITVISQRDDDHCWIGELNSVSGWFPARFVELLDERNGQQYSPLGDDSVDERISHLVRNQLCTALKQILLHDIKTPGIIAGKYHPWHFIEDVAERDIQVALDQRANDHGVQSRLHLCRAFRLDEEEDNVGSSGTLDAYSARRVLSADELMLRAVKAINASHNAYHADNDVKLRTLVCLALNEQCLHLWLETLCSSQTILQKWYLPNAFMRSPVWMQIKCELRLLAQLPFTLRHDYELACASTNKQQNEVFDVQDQNGNDDPGVGQENQSDSANAAEELREKRKKQTRRDAAVKQSCDLLDVSLMRAPSKNNSLKDSVRDMLVRYHLFSWQLHG